MPRWVRWLQPLLSGVFTVDNLDYVRRDAYLTGVAIGPVDVERLRRYTFISERGLTLFEPGLPALEMFLTSRRFIYQQVYFHRTVRAIDLDLGEVFGPSILAIFGEGSPADRLAAYADLDEYGLLHQAARWARGEAIAERPVPGDWTVTQDIADGWQAILLRKPTWRSEAEIRAEYEAGQPARCADRESRRRRTRPCRDRPGRGGRAARRTPPRPMACWRSRPVTAARRRCRPRSPRSRPTGSSAGATAVADGPSQDAGLGLATGSGLAALGFGRGGRTRSGSTRRISARGSFIRLATPRSICDLARARMG